MSDTLDLIRAVLGEGRPDDAEVRAILSAAMEREVDPLLYCSTALGLSAELAMQRAARWLGCAFMPAVPTEPRRRAEPDHLEALADIRLVRFPLLDTELAFVAPDFFQLLELRRRLRRRPALRRRLVLVPHQALRDYAASSASDALLVEARNKLTRLWPDACAEQQLGKGARYAFVIGTVLLILAILLAPHFSQLWLWPLAFFMVGPAVMRLAAIGTPEKRLLAPTRPDDAELPVYSVLIPLRAEAEMVPQLFRGLSRLDYPADRLDIKFVVESKSPETVAAVRHGLGDPRFSLVVVPDAMPRTKPKAIDYALPLCRGSHVVVFDAEDVPDPDQLWKAALRFRDEPELVCLQAHLVISNGLSHLLAALFAGEYAGLFGVMLPALARWRLPMPLGGTSNHFDIQRLRAIGGWDAFNVTEDADLGARLARVRMKVDVLDSRTLEHAPRRLKPWFGQRARWMKGWMQTFVVHNRHPVRLVREMGWRAALSFEVLTMGMITAPLLHCGLAIETIIRLALGHALLDGSALSVTYLFILVIGYGTTLVMSVQGVLRLGHKDIVAQQVLLPVYWLLIAIATARAMRELLARPFFWFKSPHEPVVVSHEAGWKRLLRVLGSRAALPGRQLT